jgi:hypothetical protein
MGNGGGLIVGMSTMGMLGPMGVIMVPGIITNMVFLLPCPTWSKCHFGQVNLGSTV